MQDALLLKSIARFAKPLRMWAQKLNTTENQPMRPQVALWIMIVLLTIGISLFHYKAYQPGTHFDDARYVILARSLLYSPNYGMINFPGDFVLAKYPFGYPLLIAIPMFLFPNNLVMLQVPSLVATILNVGLLFWGWRWLFPEKSYWWGLAVTALYAIAPMTIDQSRRIMSEPVFTFFCLAAIVLAERYVRGKRPRGWGLLISVVLTGVLFTRSIGIELIGIVFLYLLFKGGRAFWKEFAVILAQMAILVGLVVIITPVQLRDLLPLEYLKDENARFLQTLFNGNPADQADKPPSSLGPTDSVATSTTTTKSASLSVLVSFGLQQHLGHDLRQIAFPIGGGTAEDTVSRSLSIPWLPLAFGYFTSGIVIFGFIRLLGQNQTSLFLIFAVIYFGTSFVWVWNDLRLLYPIQPQIQLGYLTGIEGILLWLTSFIRRKDLRDDLQKYVLACLFGLLIFVSAYKSTQIDDSRLHTGDFQLRTNWFVTHSNPSDIIMTEAPEIDYLYGGRKTVYYPLLASPAQLEAYLKYNHVQYILVAPKVEWQATFQPKYSDVTLQLMPLLDKLQSNHRLQLAFSSEQDHVMVYRVLD
jgi:4-amino-4-deoxy-L-arabinose transferase-like glycosyltransferase